MKPLLFRISEKNVSYIFHYELEFVARDLISDTKTFLKVTLFQVPIMPTSTFFMSIIDSQKSDLFIYHHIRTSKGKPFFRRQSHHDGINRIYTF